MKKKMLLAFTILPLERLPKKKLEIRPKNYDFPDQH